MRTRRLPSASLAGPALLLPLLALVAAPLARGGEREWRALKTTYDAKLAAYEGDPGRDAAAASAKLGELQAAAVALLGEDEGRTVEHLLAHGVGSPKRAAAAIAIETLARVREARAVRDLVRAWNDAEPARRVQLATALRPIPGAEVTDALVRALRDRDEAVRATAVRTLGTRGAEARASAEPALTRLLREDSRLLAALAARALEGLTGTRPEGFADPEVGPDGLPQRFDADRVAFLIDASQEAGETAFVDPFAPPPPAPAPGGNQPGGNQPGGNPPGGNQPGGNQPGGNQPGGRGGNQPAPPALVSPNDVANARVRAALERLGGAQFLLARLGDAPPQLFRDSFEPMRGPRTLDEVTPWLTRPPRDRSRDIAGGLARLLNLTPPPQVIHVFLSGPPAGPRGVSSPEATVERLADLVSSREVVVHVHAFAVPPLHEPQDERGRLARDQAAAAYGAFVDALAAAGRGRATKVDLVRYVAPAAPETAPAASEPFAVDLTRPVTTRDWRTVADALEAALGRGDAAAEAFVESVGACPDSKASEALLPVLTGDRAPLAFAAARGLARNADARVHQDLARALRGERDGARQLMLLRALGPAPGADVVAAVLEDLDRLTPDAARLAWRFLSERPAAELQPSQAALARAGRDTRGLTGLHARQAMALASGQPPPSRAGLVPPDGAFLPERFVADGVAFVVDTERGMEQVFWRPAPAPPPAGGGANEGPGRRPRDAPDAPPPPQPVSRLEAARREVERALRALAQAELRANVLTTSGRTWQDRVGDLSRPATLAQAVQFVGGLLGSPQRDACTPLERALADPGVEEVYVLVCGLPFRSPGADDPADLHRRVRAANRARGVAIHVVYVLGPIEGPPDGPGAAARRDELRGLDALYRPLAFETGGQVYERNALASLAAAAPPAQPPPGR